MVGVGEWSRPSTWFLDAICFSFRIRSFYVPCWVDERYSSIRLWTWSFVSVKGSWTAVGSVSIQGLTPIVLWGDTYSSTNSSGWVLSVSRKGPHTRVFDAIWHSSRHFSRLYLRINFFELLKWLWHRIWQIQCLFTSQVVIEASYCLVEEFHKLFKRLHRRLLPIYSNINSRLSICILPVRAQFFLQHAHPGSIVRT